MASVRNLRKLPVIIDGGELSRQMTGASFSIPKDLHSWIGPALRRGGKGTKEACTAVTVAWVDIDKGGDAARDRALGVLAAEGIPLPTLQVRTSPGKHHLWWKLTEVQPLTDPMARTSFESRLDHLIQLTSGDGSCVDCSRTMRLPGSNNVKPEYGPDFPFAQIIAHDPDNLLDLASLPGAARTSRPRRRARGKRPSPVASPSPSAALQPGEEVRERKPLPTSSEAPFLEACGFVRHAWENAATLSEPAWVGLAWVFGQLPSEGEGLFHEFSRPHPEYDVDQATSKFRRGRDHGYQTSCARVRKLGVDCGFLGADSKTCLRLPTRFPDELIQLGAAQPGQVVLRGTRTILVTGEDRQKTIAGFVVCFDSEFRHPDGHVHLLARVLTPDGAVLPLRVPGETLSSPTQMGTLLSGTLGSRYREVDSRRLSRAIDAWLAAGRVERLVLSEDFGFTDDGTAFTGLTDNDDVQLVRSTPATERLGLAPISDEQLDHALRFLLYRWPVIGCGPFAARAVVAAAMWALVAPVCEALDSSVNPLCLWLVGPSGRGKTTAGTLAQCFFGRFERTSDGVSCGSTAGSIEITAHEFRGALLHIDDAKGSAISPGDKPKLLGAFQRLHDRTARGRLNSNSTAQRNRGGRATILVSGEDTLFDEASIRGRYLDIEVEHPQAERTREALEEIRAVRPLLSGVSHALVGHLLAEPGWGRRVLSVYQERWRALEQGLRHGDNAPRVAASMAALSAGWRLLPELAGTRGIIDEDVIRKEAALFDSALAERGNEQVHTSTEMTPAGRFIEDLQTLISSREARIDDLTEGDGRAPRIGFMKEGWVCVLPRRTVELINGKLHADGDRLPRAETVGRSLRDIGALGRSSGGRCGWRTEDPAGNSKPSVWALVPECLRSGPSGEEDE